MGALLACIRENVNPARRHFKVSIGNQLGGFTMLHSEVTLSPLIERCIAEFALQGPENLYELTSLVDEDVFHVTTDQRLQYVMDLAEICHDRRPPGLVKIKLVERGATDDNLLMQTTEPMKKHNRLASKTPGTMWGA